MAFSLQNETRSRRSGSSLGLAAGKHNRQCNMSYQHGLRCEIRERLNSQYEIYSFNADKEEVIFCCDVVI